MLSFSFAKAQDAENEEDQMLDSLLHAVNTIANDTNKLNALNKLCFLHYNVDTVNKYATIQLDLAEELKHPLYKIRALGLLYWCYYHYNDFIKANQYAYRAIVIADSIGDTFYAAKNYSNLGITFASMQDASKSNEYFHKALELYSLRGDTAHMSETLRDIGFNNYVHLMFSEAESCYNRALALDTQKGDMNALSEDYLGLGATLLSKYEFKAAVCDSIEPLLLAKEEYNKAIQIAKDNNYPYTQFVYFTEMPNVLLTEAEVAHHSPKRNMELLDSCKACIQMAYHIADRDGYETDRFLIDFANATYLTHMGQYGSAKNLLDSLEVIFKADESIHSGHLHKLYNSYSILYRKKGDYKNAEKYLNLYHYYYIMSHNQDYAIAATQNMAKARFDQQMHEREKYELQLESQAKMHKLMFVMAITMLVMAMIMGIIIIRSYNRSRKLNKVLDTKNSELTDSINYASLIQRAAMPSEKMMGNLFNEYMVIFRPLNIISGDFFWASQKGRFKAIAVGDCTGHGVPGAFLSMLGMAILEYISQRHNDNSASAGHMLDDMRAVFKHSLHQNGNETDNHDGIDIALVIIDTEEHKIYYSGAFRPLFIMRGKELVKYNADRMPIGEHLNEQEHFTDNVIDVNPGDILYLFSDGITDQFGYDDHHEVHKFTAKRLKTLLTSVAHLPLAEQKSIIENTIDDWRTDIMSDNNQLYEQTDDTTVVAVRID